MFDELEGVDENPELKKNLVIALIVLVIIILVIVAGFVLFGQFDGAIECPDGSFKGSLNECECPSECCIGDTNYKVLECQDGLYCVDDKCIENIDFEKGRCPFDCCLSSDPLYNKKNCSSGENCISNSCESIKLDCPFDCCLTDDPDFKQKSCLSGDSCVDGSCTPGLEACPFDCCRPNDKNYERLDCPENQRCTVYNSCSSSDGGGNGGGPDVDPEKKECIFDCCDGLTAYKDKACVENCSSCISNTCVVENSPCPFECCSSSGCYLDKECSEEFESCVDSNCVDVRKDCESECCVGDNNYFEKKCNSISACMSGECFIDCGDSLLEFLAYSTLCVKSYVNTEIPSGERIYSRVNGGDVDETECYIKIESIDSKKSAICTIPDFQMMIESQEWLEDLFSGKYPEFCEGDLFE